jgi:hypothetical protein
VNRFEVSRGVLSIVAGCVASTLAFNTTLVAAASSAGIGVTAQVGQLAPSAPSAPTQQTTGAAVAQTTDVVLDEFAEAEAWTADAYVALFGEGPDAGALQVQGFAGHDGVFLGDLNGSAFVANIELLDEGLEHGSFIFYSAYGTLRTGTSTVETYLILFTNGGEAEPTYMVPTTEAGVGTVLHYINAGGGGGGGGGAQNGAAAGMAVNDLDLVDCNQWPGEGCLTTLIRAECECENAWKIAIRRAKDDWDTKRQDCQDALETTLTNSCRIPGGVGLAVCAGLVWTPPPIDIAAAVCLAGVVGYRLACGRGAFVTFNTCMTNAHRDYVTAERRAVEDRRRCLAAARAAYERCVAAERRRPNPGQPNPGQPNPGQPNPVNPNVAPMP